jgi:hypothetical protein
MEPSEEMPFTPVNGSINMGTYRGTCGVLTFEYKNKTVTGLELAEISCDNAAVPILCEAH